MDTVSNLLNALYTSYILRDFLAKVVPGALLLGAILVVPGDGGFKARHLSALPVWIWLLLLGASLVVGFAIQAFGELTGLARIYPKNGNKDQARQAAIYRMVAVHRLEKPWANQQRERYVVIKEMSANMAIALPISLALGVASVYMKEWIPFLRVAFALVTAALLFWYQRFVVKVQREYEEQVIASTTPAPRPTRSKKSGA